MLPRHGGDLIYRTLPVQGRDHAFPAAGNRIAIKQINFVEHQPSGSGRQRRTKALQLTHHSTRGICGVAPVNRCDIYEVQQDPIAGQMFQKANTETGALRGTLDQPRDIRRHKRAMRIDFHYAQTGNQRRERIVRDLGRRRRYCADKRGFARIGQPQQAHIGEHFQLQLELARLSLCPRRALARGPVHARFVTRIAQAMEAALGHQQARTRFTNVAQHFACFVIQYGSAKWHG